MPELEPTEKDVDLAVDAHRILGEVGLRRAGDGDPCCGTCRHFLEPTAEVAYCWHPVHRALVDVAWRCDHHEPDASASDRPPR